MRIGAVSIALASVASPLAWVVARDSAEDDVVALAIEESRRLFSRQDAPALFGVQAQQGAAIAVQTLVGGLFDTAEIYDREGRKLAESSTAQGDAVESELPKHGAPTYDAASYQRLRVSGDRTVLRVFVPLRDARQDAAVPVTGYFEGIRVIPQWQRDQIFWGSLTVAVLVGLASLVCGAATYPVVVHLSDDNERKAREVVDSHLSMMEALGRAIAKRDSETGAHNYRVAWIAARIADKLGLSGDAMQALVAGAFLHDVGKIGTPDAILLKPGKLDDEELAVMRGHVALGEQIVIGMGWLDGAHAVVAGHHEKWDGSGYPRRLSGEQIPLPARIFAVADVFDALCSKRPYKEALDFKSAMTILDDETGRHFDPVVMAAFRPMANEIFDRLADSDEADTRQLLDECVQRHFAVAT